MGLVQATSVTKYQFCTDCSWKSMFLWLRNSTNKNKKKNLSHIYHKQIRFSVQRLHRLTNELHSSLKIWTFLKDLYLFFGLPFKISEDTRTTYVWILNIDKPTVVFTMHKNNFLKDYHFFSSRLLFSVLSVQMPTMCFKTRFLSSHEFIRWQWF